MVDSADKSDNSGVTLDDETADPSENIDAPDPALGETPRSGALSAPAIGSTADKQGRVGRERSAMDNLQAQYGSVQKGLVGAYGQQAKALQDARDSILKMNLGPSDQEAAYQHAASFTQSRGYNPGDTSTADANILAQRRAADLQKQQLLAQYGMQGAQAQIGQYGAMGNSLIQRMRIQQSADNNAETQAGKTPPARDKYWTQDPSDPTKWVDHPEMRAADVAQAGDVAKAKVAATASFAGAVTPEAVEYTQRYGKAPPGYSRNPVINSQLWQGVHAKNVAEGNTAADWFAQTQMTQAQTGVLKDFMSGPTSKEIGSLNTAVAHINTLKPIVTELANGNVGILNTIKNTWNQQVMGDPAPTDFNGVRDFVVGEISKAVLPGGGGEAERMALAKSAAQANSGQALNSIMDKWQKLLAGKTESTRNKWDIGTQGQHGDFNQFLLPATRTALGIPTAAPPARPGQGPAKPLDPLVSSYLPGGANYVAPKQ
jgi:hypothetical protein